MTLLRYRMWSFVAFALIAGCNRNPTSRVVGQTSFISSPPAGTSNGGGGPDTIGGVASPTTATSNGASQTATTPARTVEETDIYAVEGNTLYYLNSYRGLMVFDVTNIDQPKLVGRAAIFGSPVQMLVRNGIAIVVVADWYGELDDGSPFHGSIVRGFDATDPANIKVLGDAKLGGWVDDTRVVGNVLYAVSEDYGWEYGWDYDGNSTESVIVSSVSFANNVITAVSKDVFPGYSGVFNVTPNSILLAHDVIAPSGSGYYNSTSQTELLYLDISDPAGAIVKRGAITVNGGVEGWGADSGRWNLDFADGQTAHVVGLTYSGNTNAYILSTVDFTNPNAPVLKSELNIPSAGWSATARFDTNRLYLSPSDDYWNDSTTPLQVYDLTNPAAPMLAGTVQIPGSVWNILPAPNQRLFALGNDWTTQVPGDSVSLKYLDVTNAQSPQLIGTSTFGQGWAWTPAADTFKAFTMDPTQGLVVLPFSGWSDTSQGYNNGLQLIEFTPTSETTVGAAKTRGWVERGIFVGNRLVSLSDLALSVVDYSNHQAPVVTASLTLSRNVIAAQPQGATITEVSSDWWFNDVSTSEVRVLPIANAGETSDIAAAQTVTVDGVNAQVFTNGNYTYVVTSVRVNASCGANDSSNSCYARAEQVQIIDTTGGTAVLRGKVQLPQDTWGYFGWGWWGFYWYDWFDGAEVVQVGNDALAFRRWEPVYDGNGNYLDANSDLFVVDLSKPDAPTIASTTITTDPNGWWGNMRVVGETLYTTHYEWYDKSTDQWTLRYFIDRIDLTDRAAPKIGKKLNVPGLLVGGSDTDASIVYTIDYRWDGNTSKNDFDVLRLHENYAELLSITTLDGYVGGTYIQNNTAYMSAELYGNYDNAHVKLHAIDLTDPSAPIDRASQSTQGWGWLMGVVGDRAIVSSGWGLNGVDIYTLTAGQAPKFTQFARTQGWWPNAITRQDNSLFVSTGYWGVEQIDLK